MHQGPDKKGELSDMEYLRESNDSLILFLDDSAERAATFCAKMAPSEQRRTIWCTTADEAMTTLQDYHNRLNLLFLDHDLGVEEQRFKSPDSGMEVIRYIEKNHHIAESLRDNSCRVVIHTHNPSAGKIMVERLRGLGISTIWNPFGM